MRKQLLLIALILLGAIAIDLAYNKVLQSAGSIFEGPLFLIMFRWRPVILILVYAAILAAATQMLADQTLGAALSWILLVLGLVVGLVSAFPPAIGYLSRTMYAGMEALATSRLGLTLHASAILAALGLLRLVRRPA
jgi:hypothetical protein